MATEFTVKFEGEISPRMAVHINAAIQSAALGVVSQYPNPEDPTGSPRSPGGPREERLFLPPQLRGIWFDSELEIISRAAGVPGVAGMAGVGQEA